MKNKPSVLSLLCLLLLGWTAMQAATVTVTVASYNSVSLSGDGLAEMPDLEAQYQQYQTTPYKCRLTAGDSAVLVLSGWPKGTLESVKLSMHSNANSGAGSLQMKVGSDVVWHIDDASFSSASWANTYSTDYLTLEAPLSSGVVVPESSTSLRLTIKASANSLYFQQLTFSYTPAAPLPHTVSFVTGTDAIVAPVTEETTGAGVLLPTLESPAGASFIGWTAQQVADQTVCPYYYLPETRYQPTADMTLYALYTNKTEAPQPVWQDTLQQGGEYALFFPIYSALLTGTVSSSNKKMATLQAEAVVEEGRYRLVADYVPQDARYNVTFVGDSLRLTHLASGDVIGYRKSGSTYYLVADDMLWHWQKAAEHTLFISHDMADGKAQALQCVTGSSLADADVIYGVDGRLTANMKYAYWVLFPVGNLPSHATVTHYSTTPVFADVETTEVHTNARKIWCENGWCIERNGVRYSATGGWIGSR